MNRDVIETLAADLSEKGVKYAMASFVDIHGMTKAKFVPINHLTNMFSGSEMFTGAALDGVPQDINDQEVSARPDENSVVQLPWQPEVAWFASDLMLGDEAFAACSRGILKRQLEKAQQMGFSFNLGIETEFFIFKEDDNGNPVPTSERDTLAKPCYDTAGMLDNLPVVSELVENMNAMGWDVYSFDHEDANGQFETDFKYADALTMADRFTYFRMMAKEVAKKHGYFASFMPKPFANRTGSGAHYNMSLADLSSGENLFESVDDSRGCGLSELGYQFTAGILKHAPAICAVIAPTVNSYKRLIRRGSMSGSTWAPVFISYGNNNRTNMLRIPHGGGRVECRAADISCNPYLGAAIILAAGLKGIEESLDPGKPHTENMYNYNDQELAEMGVSNLPRTLGEAVEAFEADSFSKDVFGPLMHKAFIDFKQQEWIDYHNHISDWEMQRYLKFF